MKIRGLCIVRYRDQEHLLTKWGGGSERGYQQLYWLSPSGRVTAATIRLRGGPSMSLNSKRNVLVPGYDFVVFAPDGEVIDHGAAENLNHCKWLCKNVLDSLVIESRVVLSQTSANFRAWLDC